ncbi:MAG: hypothetical protein K8S25_08895 [Alphaproteobacteria bacterium]|nr:hypothetical protein [Alphaproteobacteria bacterium]
MLIRTVALLLVCLASTACATQIPRYEGPDAGYAVASIAAKKGTEYSSYRLMLRTRAGQQTQDFVWLQNNMFSSDKPDFTTASESGEVNTIKLAPGEYELYWLSVYQNGYPVETTYEPREPFSIPFTVRPQQATYLGEYLAIATYGENVFGMTVKGGPIFIVSNQQARDIAIARTEEPGVTAVQAAVPGADKLRPPLFAAAPSTLGSPP